MITIKYADINNIGVIKAFQEIRSSAIPAKAQYRFKKIAEKIDVALVDFRKDYEYFLKEYAVHDDSGQIVTHKDEDGKILGYKMKDQKVADEFYGEMLKRQIIIDVSPVDAADIAHAPIVEGTLHHLEPFISGMENFA